MITLHRSAFVRGIVQYVKRLPTRVESQSSTATAASMILKTEPKDEQFRKRPKLPKTILSIPPADQVDNIYHTFMNYSADGIGVSDDEFPNRENFVKQFYGEGRALVSIRDESTEELIGISGTRPSDLCRSAKPLLCMAYLMVMPGNEGKGATVANAFIETSVKMGYYGVAARVALNNLPAFLMTRNKFNTMSLGVIPNSVNMNGTGYIDDMIVYYLFQDIHSLGKIDAPVLPKPATISNIEPDTWMFKFDTHVWTTSGGNKVNICAANPEQKVAAEILMQNQARAGRYFGMDEFRENGMLHRRYFSESITLVAVSSNGEVIGTGIVGLSSLSRETIPKILQVYACAPNNPELETEFYRCAYRIASELDMMGLITDAFSTEAPRVKLMKDIGFRVTGSTPFSAFLNNDGYVDSLFMYLPTNVKKNRYTSMFRDTERKNEEER